MRKKLLLAGAALFGAVAMHGQAYVSVSGGYGFEINKKVVGRDATNTPPIDLKGSYGEGFQAQLRGGYFFHRRWGTELSLGYLHGEDIQTNRNAILDMNARGRAFGASLSLVFNVTKIGGRTESITKLNATLPLQFFTQTPVPSTNSKYES